jgi:hypothetical protein
MTTFLRAAMLAPSIQTHQCKAFTTQRRPVSPEHGGEPHVYGPIVLQLVRR